MATKDKTKIPIKIGGRYRLIQQIPHGVKCWTKSIEGNLLDYKQEKTGAVYCHSRDGKLWLDRIVLLQDNGEASDCILDRYSCLEYLGAPVSKEEPPDKLSASK